jgi:hypothetical protein
MSGGCAEFDADAPPWSEPTIAEATVLAMVGALSVRVSGGTLGLVVPLHPASERAVATASTAAAMIVPRGDRSLAKHGLTCMAGDSQLSTRMDDPQLKRPQWTLRTNQVVDVVTELLGEGSGLWPATSGEGSSAQAVQLSYRTKRSSGLGWSLGVETAAILGNTSLMGAGAAYASTFLHRG